MKIVKTKFKDLNIYKKEKSNLYNYFKLKVALGVLLA